MLIEQYPSLITAFDNRVDGSTLLHIAIDAKNLVAVKMLIAAGADVNAVNGLGSTPVHIAARVGIDQITHALNTSGARYDIINERGYTPHQIAERYFG